MLIEFNRNKLYEEVWKEPATKVAKRYGVPYGFLRKNCEELKVPLPSSGHWSRVKFGKNVKVPPLPNFTGEETISVEYKKPSPTTVQRIEKPLTDIEQFCSTLSVPLSLKNPHPMVKATQLYKKFKGDNDDYRADAIYFKSSDEQFNRILIFVDTLFKSVEHLGGVVKKRNGDIEICFNNEKLQLSIKEKTRRVEHVKTKKELLDEKKFSYSWAPAYDYPFAGILVLSMHSNRKFPKEWKDSAKVRIESLIGQIVLTIFETFESLKELREKREREEFERREKEFERQRLREIQESEYKQVQELESLANDYKKAQDIRCFVDGIIKYSKKLNDSNEISKLNDYITWAELKANWLDPLTAAVDPILGQKHTKWLKNITSK